MQLSSLKSKRFYDRTRVNINTYLVCIPRFNAASKPADWLVRSWHSLHQASKTLSVSRRKIVPCWFSCLLCVDWFISELRRWNNAQAPFPYGRIHQTLNSCSDPGFVIQITFVITLYWCTYTGFFSQESELEWQNVGLESWRFCQNYDWQANISGVAFYYLATQQKKKKKLPKREDFNILWLGFNAKYN